jgi:hypothetical protein
MCVYLKKFLGIRVKLIDLNADVNSLNEIPHSNFEELCHQPLNDTESFQPYFVVVSSLLSPPL